MRGVHRSWLPKHAAPRELVRLDTRAVDTVRVLAMDAVEKSGNGHPGHRDEPRAAAYLLFNR
jgi:transketolase